MTCPISQPAAPRILKTPQCPWSVSVEGEDLVVRDILATCFGGRYDAGDNGQTESGVMNDGRDPHLMGIALPIRSTEAATRNSPLAFKGPHLPWLTAVNVWRTADGEGKSILCRLIDNGPNILKFPSHALDLNPNVVLHFLPHLNSRKVANQWSSGGFNYRILGGAKYIS